jgi:hypothetical protein
VPLPGVSLAALPAPPPLAKLPQLQPVSIAGFTFASNSVQNLQSRLVEQASVPALGAEAQVLLVALILLSFLLVFRWRRSTRDPA